MKKIFLSVVWVAFSVNAYAVPKGCFITEYSSSCYYGNFYAADCDQWDMASYRYGSYISSMCTYVNSLESSNTTYYNAFAVCNGQLNSVISTRDTAISDRNTAVSVRDAAISDRDNAIALYNATEQNRKEWIAYAGKRNKLITKLYKACGAKCRRVK